MKLAVRRTIVAAVVAFAAAFAASAAAQPDIACSWDGQEAIVDRGLRGIEVWQCFGGEWYFVYTCNRDGTCNPI